MRLSDIQEGWNKNRTLFLSIFTFSNFSSLWMATRSTQNSNSNICWLPNYWIFHFPFNAEAETFEEYENSSPSIFIDYTGAKQRNPNNSLDYVCVCVFAIVCHMTYSLNAFRISRLEHYLCGCSRKLVFRTLSDKTVPSNIVQKNNQWNEWKSKEWNATKNWNSINDIFSPVMERNGWHHFIQRLSYPFSNFNFSSSFRNWFQIHYLLSFSCVTSSYYIFMYGEYQLWLLEKASSQSNTIWFR